MTISSISDGYTRRLQVEQRIAETKLNKISQDNSLDEKDKRAKELEEKRDIEKYKTEIERYEDKKLEEEKAEEKKELAEGIDSESAYDMINSARVGAEYKLEIAEKNRLNGQYDNTKAERDQDELYGTDTEKKQEELKKLRERIVFKLDGKDDKSTVRRISPEEQAGMHFELAVG